MKFLVSFFAILVMAGCAVPAGAGEISPFKECATIRNMTGQTVLGVVRTAPFRMKGGDVKRHEGTFRLEADETVDVCSTGPFYDGYKVEFVLRTIIPLFSCKTRLSGEIYIRKRETKQGYTKLYAECK